MTKTAKRYVYINGKAVAAERACVSVYDRGLNYGDGLFETMKAIRGRPALLHEHMDRLEAGSKWLKLPVGPIRGFVKEIKGGLIEGLLKRNGLHEGDSYVKVVVTRGVDTGTHAPPKNMKPTFIIIAKPLDAGHIEGLKKMGIKAIILKGPIPAIPHVKTLNHLPNVLGKTEALGRGAFEGIFADSSGRLLEGSSSNLFIVRRGVIKTPPSSGSACSPILPGVTRGAVIEAARRGGLIVKEEDIYERDLKTCEEAFVTNSIIEAVPVIKAGGFKIGSGRPGETVRMLQGFLRERLAGGI